MARPQQSRDFAGHLGPHLVPDSPRQQYLLADISFFLVYCPSPALPPDPAPPPSAGTSPPPSCAAYATGRPRPYPCSEPRASKRDSSGIRLFSGAPAAVMAAGLSRMPSRAFMSGVSSSNSVPPLPRLAMPPNNLLTCHAIHANRLCTQKTMTQVVHPMRAICIAAFLTLFLVLIPNKHVLAQDLTNTTHIDGHTWAGWPEHTRLIVLYGFVSGMNMQAKSIERHHGTVETQSTGVDNNSSCNLVKELAPFYIDNVSIEQIFQALNEMYADHSTRNIPLSDAILFTRKWIMGCSEEDFNQILLFLKQDVDVPSRSTLAIRDKEGNVLRHIPFP